MAEVRCPMCGKPNPAELEICQYCQARLKPLSLTPKIEPAPQPEKIEPKPENTPSSEVPSNNWLQDFRDEKDDYNDIPEPDEETELPDWLTEGTGSEESFGESRASESSEAEPEWLQRIRARQDTDNDLETSPLSPEEIEVPDWLSDLTGPQDQEEEQPAAPERAAERDEPVKEGSSEPAIPDWAVNQLAEPATPEAKEELPDWLSQIQAEAVETNLGREEPEPGSSAEDIPEWLSELVEPPSEKPGEQQVPEWLEQGPPERSTPEEPEELPEWLSLVSAEPAEPGPPVELNAPEEEIPDWLSIVPPAVPSEEGPAPETPDEELLEWLPKMPESATAGNLPITPAIISDSEDELLIEDSDTIPDWLSGLTAAPAEAAGPTGPAATEATAAESAEAVPPAAETTAAEPVAEKPEQPAASSPEPGKPAEAFYPEEISEWLEKEEVEAIHAPETSETEPNLTPAALPSWLEAMRPVEDIAPAVSAQDDTYAQVENAGPLAGLRGLLRAEPEIARIQKPPTYSIKLQVSDNQQTHAELLTNMLATESEGRPIPRSASLTSQHILRWLIALILIVSVAWPLVTGTQMAPLPTYPPETAEVERLIAALPPSAHVLLAFDYQPGLSGEMDAAASAVIDHLLLQGAYLTVVSTFPSGPIVAEYFLQNIAESHHYTSGEQYVNLGYIPGGPSGLLSFAESPQRTLPDTIDGQPAWGNTVLPPLQGITGLNDYSLVLVAAEDAETARSWIEQVQPHLSHSDGGSTPLVMVISAQIEPLIQPYYQANPQQVQGLVTGLRGGAAYANLTGRGGLPRSYWDAFSIGLLVAVLWIFLGGLYNIFSVVYRKRAEDISRKRNAVRQEPSATPKEAGS